jgi:hypothetical protein
MAVMPAPTNNECNSRAIFGQKRSPRAKSRSRRDRDAGKEDSPAVLAHPAAGIDGPHRRFSPTNRHRVNETHHDRLLGKQAKYCFA